ncbi:Rieske (2Fe-2S) protein [Williamsia sp. CHRR-6]|uniref:Rieske (2Fe-2S) protein n=1 Tax=Williamsia sp. CHRR-6 TaxID=2835871 RepID=UPI001BDAE384|nr:Rieske (2Fe-2S) protein [Williamsia sp. CHRR-6]MBT0567407.1 Rieske (2Fe-2S) protein [Williamsia sp. CHRR-6]
MAEEITSVTRRTALALGAGGAGLMVLAACSSSDGDDDDKSGSGSDSAAKPSAAADGSLATLADIPVGGAVAVELAGGDPGLVVRTGDATAKVFNAVCPHRGCTVKPEDKKLVCPCHNSVFDTTTGAVKEGPAKEGLKEVSAAVTNGKVIAS